MMMMINIIIIYLSDYQTRLESNDYDNGDDDDNNHGDWDDESDSNDDDLLQFFCFKKFIFVLLFRA